MTDSSTNTYTSSFLIDRIYAESSTTAKLIKVPEPSLQYTNQKTCILNFNTICSSCYRDAKMIQAFFEAELLVKTSLDCNNNLLIPGRHDNVTKIKRILKNYIYNYVICKECKSLNTILEKVDKRTIMKCNNCLSSKTIST